MSFPPPLAGWDEGEALEFSKALKQPMVLQTPLQVILEALFSRIQAQAGLFTEVLKRIDHVEAKEVPGEELLHRIQRCEESLSSINHEKLSPFHQQEILNRIENLESQASAFAPLPDKSKDEPSTRATTPMLTGLDSILRPPSSQHQGQGHEQSANRISPLPGVVNNASRLDALEQKLAGVYNLGGKLIAVEQMAAEMEIDIPDTECTLSLAEQEELRQQALPQGHTDQGHTAGTPVDPSQPLARQQRQQSPLQGQGGSASHGSGTGVHHSQGTQVHTPPGTDGHRNQSTSPRPATSDQQGEGANAGAASGTRLGTPGSLQRHSAEQNLGRASLLTPRASRQHTEQQLQDLTARVSALQADNAELHRMLDELHRAHDSLEASVQSSTAAGISKLQGVESRMTSLQESINNDLAAVAKEVRKPPEVSYADLQALTARLDQAAAELGIVGQSMQHIKTKDIVLLQEQIADVVDQMKKGQTRDMDTLFHNRLSQLEVSLGDVKTEVQLAVSDVLEDVVKVSDLQALEGLIEERATQEDLRQLAQQQGSLAQSVSQVANWMANRPSQEEGPKAAAAAGIKMKCFTCDQEIKAVPATGASGGGTRSSESTLRPKTNFLPKLDHPHSSPASHTVPLGPGINAAELRRLAEERMAGGSKKGSPLRGSEVEDYATDRSGGSPGPGRSGRTPLSSHGLNSVVTRAPNRPPVFI